MEREVFGTILGQREEEKKAGKNVATSQRRDVGSTRRGSQEVANVATPQCRNVSAISASASLKAKGTKKMRGIEKRTDEGMESRAAANQISGEDTCFCIFFFSERLLMVYRLIKCITKSSMS